MAAARPFVSSCRQARRLMLGLLVVGCGWAAVLASATLERGAARSQGCLSDSADPACAGVSTPVPSPAPQLGLDSANITRPASSQPWLLGDNLEQLPGTFSVTQGSPVAYTSVDLRSALSPGARLRLVPPGAVRKSAEVAAQDLLHLPPPSADADADFPAYSVISVSATAITLDSLYAARSSRALHGYLVHVPVEDLIARVRQEGRARQEERLAKLEQKRREEVAQQSRERAAAAAVERKQRAAAASAAASAASAAAAVAQREREEARRAREEVRQRREQQVQQARRQQATAKAAREAESRQRWQAELHKVAAEELQALRRAFEQRHAAAAAPLPLTPTVSEACLRTKPRWLCVLHAYGKQPHANTTHASAARAESRPHPRPDQLCGDGQPLRGTVSVRSGSPLVTTSVDLQSDLAPGESIRIKGQEFVVTDPRDVQTLTLSERWVGATEAGLTVCKVPNARLQGTSIVPLPGCVSVVRGSPIVRTSVDLQSEILNGESMRIEGQESTVMNPRDDTVLTLSEPYQGVTARCVRAMKRIALWQGGLIPLPGTVSAQHGASTVESSVDLRDFLSRDDVVRVGVESVSVQAVFDTHGFSIDRPFPGETVAGVKAFKEAQVSELSGSVTVAHGSPTVTTSLDLRAEIRPGDSVRIAGRQYAVTVPQDAATLTLVVPYPGSSADGLKAYRVAGTANMLAGTASATQGATLVMTSEDLRGDLVVGDRVRIEGGVYTVTDPLDRKFISVKEPYAGATAAGLRMYKVGVSAQQQTLEALAAEKLKCKTVLCLAKIEQQERGLPFQYPRTLQGGLEAAQRAVADSALKAITDAAGSLSESGSGAAGEGGAGGAAGANGAGAGAGVGAGVGAGAGAGAGSAPLLTAADILRGQVKDGSGSGAPAPDALADSAAASKAAGSKPASRPRSSLAAKLKARAGLLPSAGGAAQSAGALLARMKGLGGMQLPAGASPTFKEWLKKQVEERGPLLDMDKAMELMKKEHDAMQMPELPPP